MKKSIFYTAIFLLCSCGLTKKSQEILNKNIQGFWNVQKHSNTFYYGLEFDSSGANFYTTGDTILRFVYEFKRKNLLTLRDQDGIETSNKIIKLTQDSLIFENLLENKSPQIYIRAN
jgi:hypothetical protein